MKREEAKAALDELNFALGFAANLIRPHKPTLDRFFAEKRSMESVGPILDPTLFNSSERRATEALLSPIYDAAATFLRTFDEQTERARQALEEVQTDG